MKTDSFARDGGRAFRLFAQDREHRRAGQRCDGARDRERCNGERHRRRLDRVRAGHLCRHRRQGRQSRLHDQQRRHLYRRRRRRKTETGTFVMKGAKGCFTAEGRGRDVLYQFGPGRRWQLEQHRRRWLEGDGDEEARLTLFDVRVSKGGPDGPPFLRSSAAVSAASTASWNTLIPPSSPPSVSRSIAPDISPSCPSAAARKSSAPNTPPSSKFQLFSQCAAPCRSRAVRGSA